MVSAEAHTAAYCPGALPPQCGPFAESAPFPNAAPHFVVVHLPKASRTRGGRARARESIQELLTRWAETPVSLSETDRGPEVRTFVRGHRIFLSLSYTGNAAWVAVALERPIGLDAVSLRDCTGWEDIAPVYLGKEITDSIAKADAPRHSFAQHWATLEARCKHAGMPLREKSPPPESAIYSHSIGETVLAVAFESNSEQSKKRPPSGRLP